MSEYDRQAWEDVIRRRDRFLEGPVRRLLPERVRQRGAATARAAAGKAQGWPGANEIQSLVAAVADGATQGVSRTALSSLGSDRVVRAFRERGHPLEVIADVRTLDLRDIDAVRPRLDAKYMVAGGGAGAGAGFFISGGEILALLGAAGGGAAGAPAGGVGVAPGAGAGAAPGVATVVAAMVADAAATTFAATRLIFETAAYYGYDAHRPEERLRAMGVLNVATAVDQGAKNRAYLQLNKLVRMLVRNATWKQLDDNVITRIVQEMFRMLTERLTKQKLANTIPFVGIAIGAALNVRTLSRVGDAADLLYREQFLRDKYQLDGAAAPVDVIDGEVVDDDIPLVEIVEDEVDAATEGTEFSLQCDPAEIGALAARYSYADDSDPASAGAAAAARGHYETNEFVTVCSWKTPRSKSLVGANPPAAVESATRRALVRGPPERDRMQSLLQLRGVGVPTASALLHFANPEAYPILDVRALESLGVRGRSTYSVSFWLRYLDACRSLASQHGVSVRTLDKALWQHSKENSADA